MRNLIVGLLVIFSLNAAAQDKAEWETDVVKAVDVAIKEGKPLFMFFTGSDWCGWCKKLQREVFFKPEFHDWAEENVVLVELDFPRRTQIDPALRQQNMEIARMMGVSGYPTIWFVTPTKNNNQINFAKLGRMGYQAGGPVRWVESANKILPSSVPANN